jgi:hypothetical protein
LSASPVHVIDLRCEYLTDPLGIDARQPRLSWRLQASARGVRQTAYQVQVASDPRRLTAGQADLWDSGQVPSDQSLHQVYRGQPAGWLAANAQCQLVQPLRVWRHRRLAVSRGGRHQPGA